MKKETEYKKISGGYVFNKHGFVSGGYLFDKMDRIAQHWIEMNHEDHKFWITKSAKIHYLKQLCCPTDVSFRVKLILRMRDTVFVDVVAYDRRDQKKTYAKATFIFVGKDRLYCAKELP